MLVSTGPIALARPGWHLKPGSVTSIVADDSGGRPDVLAAQIICGAAVSGVKVLVLLPWDRREDSVWSVVVELVAAGSEEAAARAISSMPLLMYSGGTGKQYVGKAGLVYAPGLGPRELQELSEKTAAPVLTFTDLESEVALRTSAEVIRVCRDAIVLDGEGVEVPVEYDPSGPVYRPA